MRISDWSSDVCSSDLDSGRIPWIPPLPVGAWFPWVAVAGIADGAPGVTSTWVDSPPRPAWHRPTAHPAAERKSVAQGTRVSVRVDVGGLRIMQKYTQIINHSDDDHKQ